jgi:dTDP-4-dehydrorhamnose reductase
LRCELVPRREWDISDIPQVELLFEDLRPTLVINCAAYTKVDLAEQEREKAFAANCTGAKNLAIVCQENGAKLVHFSTDFVFDGGSNRPYLPDDATAPLGVYGASKLEGERAIQQVPGLDFTIIRTAWLYGPGGPSFPKTMIDVARAGKPLRVVNDQIGSPTFTDDLANATLDLIDREARGMYHVTNSGQTSWFDFARAIFEEWGLKPDLQPTTSAEWKAARPQSATRPAYSVLDLSKFEQTVGRPMRAWREALREFKRLVEPNKS